MVARLELNGKCGGTQETGCPGEGIDFWVEGGGQWWLEPDGL